MHFMVIRRAVISFAIELQGPSACDLTCTRLHWDSHHQNCIITLSPSKVLYVCGLACRQLGSELHHLHPVLPLFDGVTGEAVPQHVDNRVERLRDALMDDARERVDDLGEDLVVGLPLA